MSLHTLLLIVHISAAAILVGGGMGLRRHLLAALALGGKAFELATQDAARRSKVMGICSLVTLLTGVLLILSLGGFKVAPLNFHFAFGVMVLFILASLLIMRPAVGLLVEEAKKAAPDTAAATAALKKIAMGQGMLHLFWLTNLVLMLVRIHRSA